MSGANLPIRFAPGINPEPDETKQNTAHIIDGNNIRFWRGGVQKMAGHKESVIDTEISGCPRTILSYEKNNKVYEIIGTHSHLYAKRGSTVTNITPLVTSATTLGTDPGRTRYDDAQSTPFGTTSGSKVVTVLTFLFTSIRVGDSITISGVSGAVNGIPDTELNGTHEVISISGGDDPQIRVDTAATSTGFPAVANVVIVMRTFRIAHTAHGYATGDRVKISGFSGTVGGVAATEINGEHIIRVVDDNNYVIPISTDATSLASGGGSSVDEYAQITAGECDAVAATGPGIGTPGFGYPGEIFTDTSLSVQPRIWWADLFGDTLVCGPGQGGKCYEWDSDTAEAPTIISNAPDADWGWVEGSKLVTLLGNTVANSDTGDYTAWTPGAASSAYTDDKEDANKLIGRAYANGENLILAEENKMFRMRWVSGAVKWVWTRADIDDRILGPHAWIALGGIIYLFCEKNIYAYNGGIFTPLPGNTLFRWIYSNLNNTQRRKAFIWFNTGYQELHMHYPGSGSIENDRAVVFSLQEGHFTKREGIDRTAADRGGSSSYPVLANSDGILYQHELGVDDGNAALNSWFQVAFSAIAGGKYYTEITGFEPDAVVTGEMTVELYGKDRSRGGDGTLLESFTLTEATQKVDCDQEARWRSWLIRSNVVGGNYRIGSYKEFVQKGAEF